MRVYESFAGLERVWEPLYQSTPYQSFEWNALYWKHFGRERDLVVVLAVDAILPLRRRLLDGVSVLEFVGARGTDYLDGIGSREAIAETALRLDEIGGWDVLRFEDVSESAALATTEFPQFATRSANVECASIDLPSQMSVRTRRDVAYYRRRLERFGGSAHFVWRDAREHLGRYLEVHIQRQRAKAGPAYFGSRTIDFARDFFLSMADQQKLLLIGFYLGDALAAGIVAVEWQQDIFACYVGLDPALAAHQPGWLLWDFALHEAFDRGYRRIDLGRGTDPYKYRLGGRARHNLLVEVARASDTFDRYRIAYRRLMRGRSYEPQSI